MAEGQIVLDGRPGDVFYDEYEALQALNLRPPSVIDFCRRLEHLGMPRCLTVDEVIGYVEEVKKRELVQE